MYFFSKITGMSERHQANDYFTALGLSPAYLQSATLEDKSGCHIRSSLSFFQPLSLSYFHFITQA